MIACPGPVGWLAAGILSLTSPFRPRIDCNRENENMRHLKKDFLFFRCSNKTACRCCVFNKVKIAFVKILKPNSHCTQNTGFFQIV